jgi:hypothetical protein
MFDRKRKTVMLLLEEKQSECVRERLIISCLALTHYLSADLEIFVPTLQEWPSSEVLSRFGEVPHFRVGITAFGTGSDVVDEIKSEIHFNEPALLVLERSSMVKRSTESELLLRQRILAEVAVPILLLSCRRGVLKIPFLSLFVPMSGEARASPALEWSIEFANERHLPVDLLHVTHPLEEHMDDPSLIGEIYDEFYHEYPYLISELIAQGSPYSSMSEQSVIRHFIHCTGGELEQIIKYGRLQAYPLVVIEWKGSFERGHARVLKGILAQTDWPVLLTRHRKTVSTQLKHLRKLQAA